MKLAAFTMAFNENVFLPIWLEHYGSAFGHDNLFVIDDGSDDGSIFDQRLRNVLSRPRGTLDEDFRSALISAVHRELLSFYDVVLYTDADELIVLEPKLDQSLAQYLAASQYECKTTIGLDVVHDVYSEDRLTLSGPLFAQRHFVRFNQGYCKPLISKVPIEWVPGFHESNRAPNLDPNLLLFHLRSMDISISRERIRTLNKVTRSANAIRKGHGVQFGWSEKEFLDHLYGTPPAEFAAVLPNLDPIVDAMRRSGSSPNYLARVPSRFKKTIELTTLRGADESTGAPPAFSYDQSRKGFGDVVESALRKCALNPRFRRNDLCPCGSGRKIKHCHGTVA